MYMHMGILIYVYIYIHLYIHIRGLKTLVSRDLDFLGLSGMVGRKLKKKIEMPSVRHASAHFVIMSPRFAPHVYFAVLQPALDACSASHVLTHKDAV